MNLGDFMDFNEFRQLAVAHREAFSAYVQTIPDKANAKEFLGKLLMYIGALESASKFGMTFIEENFRIPGTEIDKLMLDISNVTMKLMREYRDAERKEK